MDDFMGELNARLNVSITDSTMVWIVHEAMQRAHEKVQSRGAISRLTEMSKFYELAAMQLEGCLKFLQEEADSCTLEMTRQDLLADLVVIRDHLRRRLVETEMAIAEKDRELTERAESEMRLRQAMEMIEIEMASLRSEPRLQRGMSIEESSISSAWATGDEESREGEFCELKNSLNQQVWNIKQKLDHDYEVMDDLKEQRSSSSNDGRIDRTGSSDIDALKETLDLAFLKMHDAIFLSEMRPLEQQWRWSIERDVTIMSIKDFIRHARQDLESAEFRRLRNKTAHGVLGENLSALVREIALLRYELESLSQECDLNFQAKNCAAPLPWTKSGSSTPKEPKEPLEIRNDHQRKQDEGDREDDEGHLVARMIKSHESIIRQKSEELNWLKGENCATLWPKTKSGSSTPKEPKEPLVIRNDHQRKQDEGNEEDEEGHLVTKMIKSHEFIIQQKSEELNWLKGENFLKECSSSDRKEEDSARLRRRIRDVIFRADQIIKLNSKLSKQTKHRGGGPPKDDNYPHTMSENFKGPDKTGVLCAVDAQMVGVQTDLERTLLSEIYITLLKGMKNEFISWSVDFELDVLIREHVIGCTLKEIVLEHGEEIVSNKIESLVREQLCSVFLSELKRFRRYIQTSGNLDHPDCEDALTAHCESPHPAGTPFDCLEGQISNLVQKVVLSETMKAWNDVVESHIYESLSIEDECHITYCDVIKMIIDATKFTPKLDDVSLFISNSGLQCALEKDICMTFLKVTAERWRNEMYCHHIERSRTEEIHQFVIGESLRCARYPSGEAESQESNNVAADIPSVHDLEFRGDKRTILDLDSMLEASDAEEIVPVKCFNWQNQNAGSGHLFESKECKTKLKVPLELSTSEDNGSILVRSEPEKALHPVITNNKGLSIDLDSSFGSEDTDIQSAWIQEFSNAAVMDHQELSIFELNHSESMQSNPLYSIPQYQGLLQAMLSFQQTLHDQLVKNIKRCFIQPNLQLFLRLANYSIQCNEVDQMKFSSELLEKICIMCSLAVLDRVQDMENQLHASIELVGSLRKSESLYKNAFIRRCQNLQMAEAEVVVDLLGDQVDALHSLLETIYVKLRQLSPALQKHLEVN